MNASLTQTLITDGLTTFGLSILAILAAVLVVGIGYLVYFYGYRAIQNSVMGSQGMAFGFLGDPAPEGSYYGISDVDVNLSFSEYQAKGGTMGMDEFSEMYYGGTHVGDYTKSDLGIHDSMTGDPILAYAKREGKKRGLNEFGEPL